MIEPKGFDIKRGYPKPKPTGKVDTPAKPEPDTEVSLKDLRTFLQKFTTQEFLYLVLGEGGTWGRWIRLIIGLIILLTLVYNSIF